MPKQIITNPPPPPTPKLIFIVELVTLAAIIYLISVTKNIELKLNERGFENEKELM